MLSLLDLRSSEISKADPGPGRQSKETLDCRTTPFDLHIYAFLSEEITVLHYIRAGIEELELRDVRFYARGKMGDDGLLSAKRLLQKLTS